MQDNTELSDVPIKHLERMSPLLQAGERVLWSGRPDLKALRRTTIGPTKYFALIWLAWVMIVLFGFDLISVIWSERLHQHGGMVVFILILIGIWSFYAHVRERRVAEQTLFVVTDLRAMVIPPEPRGLAKQFFGSSFRDYGRGSMQFLHVVSTRNGFGNIVFASGRGPNTCLSQQLPLRGFVGIRNVDQVAELIRKQEYAPHASAKAPLTTRFFARF